MSPSAQRPAAGRLHRAELAFAVLGCLVFSRGFAHLIFPYGDETLGENLLYLALYTVTALLLLRHWRAALSLLAGERFLALLIALAALSALWSLQPVATALQAVALGATALFAVYLLLRHSVETQLGALAAAMAVVCAGSLFSAAAVPDVGVMQGLHEGAWRGVYSHKNLLGRYMVLAGAVFFALALRSAALRPLLVAGYCTALFLLLMSCSKASHFAWIILFGSAGAYLAVSRRWKPALAAVLGVAVAGGSLWLQSRYDALPPILLQETASCLAGKAAGSREPCNILLTTQELAPPSTELNTGRGRVKLWTLLLDKVAERPVLGVGLGAFWSGDSGPANYIWENQRWRAQHAHNGFLDLVLHLGLSGLALLLAALAVMAFRLLRHLRAGSLDDDLFAYALLVAAVLLANVGESELVRGNSLMWVLLVAGPLAIQQRRSRPA